VKCNGGVIEFPSREKLEETFGLFVSLREQFADDERDVSDIVDCNTLQVTNDSRSVFQYELWILLGNIFWRENDSRSVFRK